MKFFSMVWLALCLCFLSTGCDKENVYYYTDDLLSKNEINDVEVFFESRSYDNHNVWYYGLRRGKEWFALFENNTGSLIKEWYGKELSAKELALPSVTFVTYPNPYKMGIDEYLLWYLPCSGRLNTNIKGQLIHLQTNGAIKYYKTLTDKDEYWPTSFLKGVGWYAHASEDRSSKLYDPYFENIIVEDAVIADWDSLELYTGFRNEIFRVGITDGHTLINEYLTDGPFERNRKIHLGYGEYKEYRIKTISEVSPISTKWGYAFIPCYRTVDGSSFYQDVILLNDGKVICCQDLINDYSFNNESLQLWYNESILVNMKYVISSQGEKLVEGDFSSASYSYNIPTSHSSWMTMDKNVISMYKIGVGLVWRSKLDKPIADKAHITYTHLKQEKNYWSFRCDIVNYDGSKNEIVFNINIETGEITYI